MARMTRMARMARMARSLARMARWLADLADPYQITTFHTIFLLSNNYYSYLPTQFPVKIQHILTLFPHPQKLRCYVIKITWTSVS